MQLVGIIFNPFQMEYIVIEEECQSPCPTATKSATVPPTYPTPRCSTLSTKSPASATNPSFCISPFTQLRQILQHAQLNRQNHLAGFRSQIRFYERVQCLMNIVSLHPHPQTLTQSSRNSASMGSRELDSAREDRKWKSQARSQRRRKTRTQGLPPTKTAQRSAAPATLCEARISPKINRRSWSQDLEHVHACLLR